MWLTKFKATAAVVALTGTLLAVGTGVLVRAQLTRPEPSKAPVPETPQPRLFTSEQLVDSLARARIEALRKLRDDMFRLYRGGEVRVGVYLDAQKRFTDAIVSYSAESWSKAGSAELRGLTQLGENAKELLERGQIAQSDLLEIEAARLDAAIGLVGGRTGARPSLERSAGQGLLDRGSIEQALLDLAREPKRHDLGSVLAKPVNLAHKKIGKFKDFLSEIEHAGYPEFEFGTPIDLSDRLSQVYNGREITAPASTRTWEDTLPLVLEPLGLTYRIQGNRIEILEK